MKFSFTKNPESDFFIFFFIKNPNITKIILANGRGGGGGGGVVARVKDFFRKYPSMKKN